MSDGDADKLDELLKSKGYKAEEETKPKSVKGKRKSTIDLTKKDDGLEFFNFRISAEMKKKIKVHSAITDKTIQEIGEEAFALYFKKYKD